VRRMRCKPFWERFFPGYVRPWRATANALEAAAAMFSDTVMILDELGVVEAREAATAIYQLASERGKGAPLAMGVSGRH